MGIESLFTVHDQDIRLNVRRLFAKVRGSRSSPIYSDFPIPEAFATYLLLEIRDVNFVVIRFLSQKVHKFAGGF